MAASAVLRGISEAFVAGGILGVGLSRPRRNYPEDRYVGASLELFASIALMFWYVLRIFLDRR